MIYVKSFWLKYCLTGVIYLFPILALCQPIGTQKLLPVIVPSSPEAASFQRYGNYQVNLFTGVPDISIPLYEVKIGGMTVPINLTYHASGMKVTDIPSRVGLGWDLQAGGSITRKIMGKADELGGNYLSATSSSANRVRLQSEIDPSSEDGLTYLQNVNTGLYDVEPDIFSFSFPGHGGKFLFNQKDSFKPITIPFSPISINWSKPTESTLSLGVTDESGVGYQFDTQETTSAGGGISTTCTSAWLLSDMISANKQDVIHFNYVAAARLFSMSTNVSDYVVLTDACTGSYAPDQGFAYSDMSGVATTWQRLSEIDFRGGKVVFEQAPDEREDFGGIYGYQHRLTAIKVYSSNENDHSFTLVKTVNFLQSYFENGADAATKRLRLDAIQMISNNGVPTEVYSFNYNTTVLLPNNMSRSKDFWGYFNNVINLTSNGVPTMVPKTLVTLNTPYNGQSSIYIGGDHINARDPDTAYMQAEILQRITYPTGGHTQFEFETNKYLDAGGNAKYAGGLRIKAIKNYSREGSLSSYKSYKYGLNETGLGRNNFLLEDHFFVSVQNYRKGQDVYTNSRGDIICSGVPCNKTVRTYFADPTNDLESYDGAPVVYSNVTEYFGDSLSNSGKTVYNFSDITDAKTDIIGLGKPIITSYHFERGLLTDKTVYKGNSPGSLKAYSKIAETKSHYRYFPFQNSTGGIGLVVFRSLYTENGSSGVSLDYVLGCMRFSDNTSFQYNNYEIVSGDNKLISEEQLLYDPFDDTKSSSTLSLYTYDDLIHLQMTMKETINSKMDTVRNQYTYPYNYVTVPYNYMNTNHIFNKPVEEKSFNNSILLFKKVTNFGIFGTNFLPSTVQTQIKTAPLELRVSFNNYDATGNILDMQQAGDMKHSLIWDYSKVLPVAEVTNSGAGDIAFTSFESSGKGNWVYGGSPLLDPNSVTGRYDYELSSGPISFNVLSTGSYRVSYWSKNGPKMVNGSSGAVSGRKSRDWIYYEHNLSLNPNDSVVVTGNGVIDELRLYPGNSQMVSYTYDPLVGQTAMSAPSGLITYFEYDAFNRLKNIKDYQGNIVKNFQYNYGNSCGSNCVVLTMQTFTGYNTPSYPVGVFNGNKQYVGIATSPSQFVTMWNGNAANQAIGVLSIGGDSLHFNLSLANNASAPPVVYGLRFYQWDVFSPTNVKIGTDSLSFISWGDGQVELTAQNRVLYHDTDIYGYYQIASIIHHDPLFRANVLSHNYNTTQPRTITVFHNETTEYVSILNDGIDYTTQDANIRGYFPEKVKGIGYTSLNNSSDVNVNNIGKLTELVFLDYLFQAETSIIKHNNFQSYNNSHKLQWIKMHYKNGLEVVSDIKNNFPNLKIMELFGYKVDNLVSWSNGGLKNAYVILMVPPSGEVITTTEIDAMISGQAAAGPVNGYFGFIPNPTRSTSTTAAFNTLAARGWYLGEIISPQ